jgi:hypothetical protein
VLNIEERYPAKTIILLDGGGYKPGAERWIRNKIGQKLLHVFNMREYHHWVNDGNL